MNKLPILPFGIFAGQFFQLFRWLKRSQVYPKKTRTSFNPLCHNYIYIYTPPLGALQTQKQHLHLLFLLLNGAALEPYYLSKSIVLWILWNSVLASSATNCLLIIPFLISWGMDEYSHVFAPAPDSAAGFHSAAVKGVAGGVSLLLLVVIIYVVLRSGGFSMNCKVRIGDAIRGAEEEAWKTHTHGSGHVSREGDPIYIYNPFISCKWNLYLSIYIYTHTYMCVYVHIYIYIWIIHTHTCMHICVCEERERSTHTYICIYVCVSI